MALVNRFGYTFVVILLVIFQHLLVTADGQEVNRIGLYPQQYSPKEDESARGYEDSPIEEGTHGANFKRFESHFHIEPTDMSHDTSRSLMQSPQHDTTSDDSVEERYDDDRSDTDFERDADYERTSGYFENIDESTEHVDDEITGDRPPRPIEPLNENSANAGGVRPDDDVNIDTKTARVDNHPKAITRNNDELILRHRRLRGVDKRTPSLSNFRQSRPNVSPGMRSLRREDFRQTSDQQAVFHGNDRPSLIDRDYYKSNSNLAPRDSHLDLRLGHPDIIENARHGMYATDAEEADGKSSGNEYYREVENKFNWRSQPSEHRGVYLPRAMDADYDDDDYDDDGVVEDDSVHDRRMNSLRGVMDVPKDVDVSMMGPGWTVLDEPIETHPLPFSELESQESQSLNHEYKRYFGELDDSIAFEMPELHVNCWLQAMMATTWGFSPSCNEDGTYGPKQCHEKRCWCVDKSGRKVQQHGGKTDEGFYFGLRGLTLYCSEN